jgi:MFS family permease
MFHDDPGRQHYGVTLLVLVAAALAFALSSAALLFSGPIAGLLGDRGGSKLPLLIGTTTTMSCFAWLAVFHDTHLSIYVGSALLGIGIGFAFASMANLIVDAVDQTEVGVATGINTIMRTIGGSLGGQISAAVIAGHLAAGGRPEEQGFVFAFVISAVGLALATVAAAAIPIDSRRRNEMRVVEPAPLGS